MLRLSSIVSCLSALLLIIPDSSIAQKGETLIGVDTIQISSSIKPMIVKYFTKQGGYKVSDPKSGRMLGRFEVSFLGSRAILQTDTVQDIERISFEDANFDNILDLKIIEMTAADGGGDLTQFWFYDPQIKKFKFGIGHLSEPAVEKDDSTIGSEWSCCVGTEGGSETYKLVDGVFKKIKEEAWSEEGSQESDLIGDSLVTTSFETVTPVHDGILADSSWKYLFGKLRLVGVDMKIPLEGQITPEQNANDLAYEDVEGRFLYISTETFEYEEGNDGQLRCKHLKEVVKDNRWIRVIDNEIPVEK